MNFASDNISGVHPQIMAAIVAANDGKLPSYGADKLTRAAEDMVREVLDAPEAAVYFVATGTAANALALSVVTPPWGRVFCHETAHIQTSEANAPEFFIGGGKLVPVRGEGGKMTPAGLKAALVEFGRSSVHSGANAALSLTNGTELGTAYGISEIAELADIAHNAGMQVHLDGARFANAVAGANVAPADMTWRAGVDLLSFGGTKNGCMGVEAVVIFDPSTAEEFAYCRKRGGHLLSKHRFLSAQMLAWLQDGLWLKLARHANDMAQELGQGLSRLPGVRIDQKIQTNGVFATLPHEMVMAAKRAGASFHIWPGDHLDDGKSDLPVRFVCSWSTTPDEVSDLLAVLAKG